MEVGDAGEYCQWQGRPDQAVVQPPGVGPQHQDAAEGQGARNHGGRDGASPEVGHQGGGAPEPGVIGQEHGGEERDVTTASAPPSNEVGLTQLPTGSPPMPVAGTRLGRDAAGHRTMKNGVITDDRAKAAPVARCSRVRRATLRKAKPDPRNTMPSAARPRGMYSVRMMAAKAGGKAVQSTTRQKISQTWLASHTGPKEASICSRAACPRSAPPAIRSQNPAPKSAPPNTA